MRVLALSLVAYLVAGCESMSVTHQIPSSYKPLKSVGVIFNSSDDVCVFGEKYSEILDHKEVVVGTSISVLKSLGLRAEEIDIRDYGAKSKVLTERLSRSNTAEILDTNLSSYEKIMTVFDVLLVMEHDSLTGNWLQGDCYGAISITPLQNHTQYGSFSVRPDPNNLSYAPPIMWIFKKGQYQSKGVGVYLHRTEGVPFPFSHQTDRHGIQQFLSFYKGVIETELRKAFTNSQKANGI